MRGFFLVALLPVLSSGAEPLTIFCEGRLMDDDMPRAIQAVTFTPQLKDEGGRKVANFSPADYSLTTDEDGYFSFYATLADMPAGVTNTVYLELGQGLPPRKFSPVPLAAVAKHAATIVPDASNRLSTKELTSRTIACTGVITAGRLIASSLQGGYSGLLTTTALTAANPDLGKGPVKLMSATAPGTLDMINVDPYYWTSRESFELDSGSYGFSLKLDMKYSVKQDGLCFVMLKPNLDVTICVDVAPDPTYTGTDKLSSASRRCGEYTWEASNSSTTRTMIFPVRRGERVTIWGTKYYYKQPSQPKSAAAALKIFTFGKTEE